jgi:hypothetical protein
MAIAMAMSNCNCNKNEEDDGVPATLLQEGLRAKLLQRIFQYFLKGSSGMASNSDWP